MNKDPQPPILTIIHDKQLILLKVVVQVLLGVPDEVIY